MIKDIEEFKRLRGELGTIYNIAVPLKTEYNPDTWFNKIFSKQNFQLKCAVFNQMVQKVNPAYWSLQNIAIDNLTSDFYLKLFKKGRDDEKLLSILNKNEDLLQQAKENLLHLIEQLQFFIDNRFLPATEDRYNIDEPLTEVEKILFINYNKKEDSIKDLKNLSLKVMESLDRFICSEKKVMDKKHDFFLKQEAQKA